jgi:hypothetical protein
MNESQPLWTPRCQTVPCASAARNHFWEKIDSVRPQEASTSFEVRLFVCDRSYRGVFRDDNSDSIRAGAHDICYSITEAVTNVHEARFSVLSFNRIVQQRGNRHVL